MAGRKRTIFVRGCITYFSTDDNNFEGTFVLYLDDPQHAEVRITFSRGRTLFHSPSIDDFVFGKWMRRLLAIQFFSSDKCEVRQIYLVCYNPFTAACSGQ